MIDIPHEDKPTNSKKDSRNALCWDDKLWF